MSDLARPIAILFAGAGIAFLFFMGGVQWYGNWYQRWSTMLPPISDGLCSIAVIPIQGEIVPYDGFYDETEYSAVATSGDFVERYLKEAEADPNIFGVVVEIDSGGGYGAASMQIMNAIKNVSIPVVAYVREVGASGAYLAATAADSIIASPFATVGSIGVTYSYVDNVQKNKNEGLNFVELASGPYKDTGNPNKPLSEAERRLFERDLEIFADVFIEAVARNRALAEGEVRAMADGSAMPASLALEQKLIDAVGSEDEVRAWFAASLERDLESIILCK
ncbi:MAG: S49 family peptidase [Candidatus Kaiserbacteria bacterium]|nr:MAG: S49 family peptidase [Candidatus Kaiserbacteria bacterium]